MAVNARTEEFQHIEVFDKPALFTNGRIARDTVPKGWYCYDIRGSDDDPGELCYMEENVVVNHAGSVLMPEKLAMPKSGRLDVRDELGFLDEGDMTLREFCEAHQLPYPAENMKFHIRPARPEEAGLFYTPHPEEDKRLGRRCGKADTGEFQPCGQHRQSGEPDAFRRLCEHAHQRSYAAVLPDPYGLRH